MTSPADAGSEKRFNCVFGFIITYACAVFRFRLCRVHGSRGPRCSGRHVADTEILNHRTVSCVCSSNHRFTLLGSASRNTAIYAGTHAQLTCTAKTRPRCKSGSGWSRRTARWLMPCRTVLEKTKTEKPQQRTNSLTSIHLLPLVPRRRPCTWSPRCPPAWS